MAKYLLEMFAVSLGLTLAIELAVCMVLGMRTGRQILLVILVNILTNPAAVLLCWLGIPQIPIEIAVVAVEVGIYYCFSKEERWNITHPVLLSAALNILSYSAGLLIQWIGGKL